MRFRTEIERIDAKGMHISHDSKIVMLGSCFTDNIGGLLERDGFSVTHNPMGTLYNPASIYNAVNKIVNKKSYTPADFAKDDAGDWHCLDFASRYSCDDASFLATTLNAALDDLRRKLISADTVIITLGTAYVYRWLETQEIVGNCHKFPSQRFVRERLTPEQCFDYLKKLEHLLAPTAKTIIYTVSPIRHLGDTLHGNQLSKSTLLLAVDQAVKATERAIYFPAYEIVLDDLRDYRFFASDMTHPSETAIDYIYEVFSNTFFSEKTKQEAVLSRKEWKQKQHRTLPKI